MTDESQRLIASLTASDQLKGYLSNLEQLKDEGAVAEEQYVAAKADYETRLASTSHEVEMLRGALSARVEIVRHDIATLRPELGKGDVRYKAGEISLAKSRNMDKEVRTQLEKLEQDEKQLASLLTADSAAGLVAPKTTRTQPSVTRMKPKTESTHVPAESSAPTVSTSSSRFSASELIRSKPRIAALVISVVLLISVRMPWFAPSEMLSTESTTEAGVTVSFLVGLGGLICGLAGIGIAFIRSGGMRGTLHIVLGVFAMLALGAAIALGEIPLHNSYYRQLIVMREGLYVYILAALVLIVLGMLQRRES